MLQGMTSTAAQASIAGRPEVIDVYARVSRKGDRNQRSVSGQVAASRAVLAARGLTAGEVLKDDGRSAWNPRVKRDGWDQLMARLESGASAGVVVFDLERFTRQPREGERLIDAAERGLTVLDSDAEFDLTTASGKKAFRDAMAAAAYYSDRLSDRVKRGKKAKAMAGEVDNGGKHRAFGFEEDNVTVHEPEAAVIRFLAGHILHGDPQLALVDFLNRRGIKTAKDGPWTVHALAMMLTRERNRGNITHAGVVVARLPGEPILDDDTFSRLIAVYAARRRGRPPSGQYLASGVLTCGTCGVRLGCRPVPQKRPYPDGEVCREYFCTPRLSRDCADRARADQRAVDDAVRELALAILADPRNAAQIEAAAAAVAEEADTLDTLIARDEELALELSGRLGRDEITLARYDAVTRPLDRRLAGLRERRARLSSPEAVPARQSRAAWEARWEAADPGERRDLLKMALRGRHLVIAPAGTGQGSRALTDVRRRITVS
jgi:site-specific DNA recombinase